jgi:hypothetical protein
MDNHAIKKRDTWKLMSKIRDIILDNNGMIFGGYVRDMIIHDYFATQFYDEVEDNDDRVHRYADPTFSPETFDRTCVPYDIDFFIHEDDFEQFKDDVEEQSFKMHVKFVRDPRDYFFNFDITSNTTLRHRRVYISPNLFKIEEEIRKIPINMSILKDAVANMKRNLPSIKLDIITSGVKVLEPFFSPIDFDCNALYMTKHGMSVSSKLVYDRKYDFLEKNRILNEIIENITEKRTEFRSPPAFRSKKLLDKGWTIFDSSITTIIDDSYEGYCIICHDQLKGLHIKSQCCDCRFHAECLVKTIQQSKDNTKCIMCKKYCDFGPRHIELLREFPKKPVDPIDDVIMNDIDLPRVLRIPRYDIDDVIRFPIRVERHNVEDEEEEGEHEEVGPAEIDNQPNRGGVAGPIRRLPSLRNLQDID